MKRLFIDPFYCIQNSVHGKSAENIYVDKYYISQSVNLLKKVLFKRVFAIMAPPHLNLKFKVLLLMQNFCFYVL